MPRSNSGLSEKQRRFVEAYMGEAAGNGTLAAKIAGYGGGKRSQAVRAAQALKNPLVQAAIKERQENDPLVATRQDRQRFWTRVMKGEEPTYLVGPDGDAKSMALPIEMKDRLKASELLAKGQADFVEKVEHTGKDGGPIKTEAGLSDKAAELLRKKVLGLTK